MLRVIELVKVYGNGREKGETRSLDGVNLEVSKGEVMGLVGVSGAGKSTLAHCILGLERPTRGQILFENMSVGDMPSGARKKLWRRVQIIWQNPICYLNPYMRVNKLISEPLENFNWGTKRQIRNKVGEWLEKVEIGRDLWNKYPHELSGGQCQRIAIARALSLEPELLVCDEPFSALDAQLQIHILNLLKTLKRELRLTVLFITHDLSVARHFCTAIAVMHKGKIIENDATEKVFRQPEHSHTRLLIDSMLSLEGHFPAVGFGAARPQGRAAANPDLQ